MFGFLRTCCVTFLDANNKKYPSSFNSYAIKTSKELVVAYYIIIIISI